MSFVSMLETKTLIYKYQDVYSEFHRKTEKR